MQSKLLKGASIILIVLGALGFPALIYGAVVVLNGSTAFTESVFIRFVGVAADSGLLLAAGILGLRGLRKPEGLFWCFAMGGLILVVRIFFGAVFYYGPAWLYLFQSAIVVIYMAGASEQQRMAAMPVGPGAGPPVA